MKFRPCIDIHDGKVKQIVGGSLIEDGAASGVSENFVSDKYDAAYYANMYKGYDLTGGHIILLNKQGTPAYEADMYQAGLALSAYSGGFQIGGGIDVKNAEKLLDMGASHVIVTSYVFADGKIHYERLKNLVSLIGKERLVLDLSCRRKDNNYYVVTDRWQKFTDLILNKENVFRLLDYCDEFLIHAVDVEGRQQGIEENVAGMLGSIEDIKVTYAGGISSYEDIELLNKLGNGRIDFAIGSSLDIFGGKLNFVNIAQKYA